MRGLGCVLAVVGSVSCHDGGDQVEGPVTVAPVVKKAVEASAPNAAALSIDPPIVAAATFDGRSGQEVYEQICAMCHGETGDGKGIVPLDRPARSFLTGTFSFGNTRDALFKSVSNGIGGTPMPGFEALLTEDERYAVVDYIIAMGPEREVVELSATVMTVTDRPLVVRGGFSELVEGGPIYPRGALLGGLDGLSFQYDVSDVRLVGVRQGDFVERRDWENRGGDTLKPLGKLIHMPEAKAGQWKQVNTPLWARLSATEVGSEFAYLEYDLIARATDLTPIEQFDFTKPMPAVATVREFGEAISRGGWSGYRRTFEVTGADDVTLDLGTGSVTDWGARVHESDGSAEVTVMQREPSASGSLWTVELYFGLPATPTNLAALKEAL